MKTRHLPCLLALLLGACTPKPTTNTLLQGEIKGAGNDTLLLYGTDRLYDHKDTLIVTNGKFAVELFTDTLANTRLLFADGTELPVYFQQGEQITIKGEADRLQEIEITGNPHNEALTTFRKAIAALPHPTPRQIEQKADSFIKTHSASIASLYVLDKYFVQQPEPNLKRIEQFIESMTGELKDRQYTGKLQQRIDDSEKIVVGKTLPYFSLPNAEGEKKSRNSFRDKYLLLHFWASWHPQSREAGAMLRRFYKKHKKSENIALIGISLDIDRQAWTEAIEHDTLKWEQLSDLKGWESEAARIFSLQQLPVNLLVDNSGRIIKCNITEEELNEEIKTIDKKMKEKREREKARKNRNKK